MSPAAFSPLRRRVFLQARARVAVSLTYTRVHGEFCWVRTTFGVGRFPERSGRVVLECLCGEKLVLLGREQDCQEEGSTVFRCECGRELTPAEDRADERALAIGELLRRSIKAARSV